MCIQCAHHSTQRKSRIFCDVFLHTGHFGKLGMQSPQYMWPHPTNACSTSLLKHTRHCQLLRAASSSDSLRCASCRNSATAAEACTHTTTQDNSIAIEQQNTAGQGVRHTPTTAVTWACTNKLCHLSIANAEHVCDKRCLFGRKSVSYESPPF